METTAVFPAAGAGPSCGEQRQLLEFLLCSLSLCETRGYIKLKMSLPQLKEKVAHTHTSLYSVQSVIFSLFVSTVGGELV